MDKIWYEELWEPLEISSQLLKDLDDVYPEPRRRSFMELDDLYDFDVPGLFPRSRVE